ncbi:MAG: ABC transporter permease [Saprospiraceae bacterium]|nr:MAG: ABC transporter permease [Saprospiraceae bacterium]
MSLGLAAAFVLLFYTYRELTYDQNFRDADRIYRVATDFFNMGGFAKSQEGLLPAISVETPEIELSTRFDRGFRDLEVKAWEQKYEEKALLYVDSTFFRMFSFPFVEGDPTRVLQAPGEVVLSLKVAKKYFGNAQAAMGKTIYTGKEEQPYEVTGVIDNSNLRTHIVADLWFSLAGRLEGRKGWTNVSLYNYVKLNESSTVSDLQSGLDALLKNAAYPSMKTDLSYEEWVINKDAVKFFIQPLQDIYLKSDFSFEVSTGGNATQVYVLGIIGLFIIFLAGVNYINLTTARSMVRAKEIAIKKTLGAEKKYLISQFLGESVWFSLLAVIVAGGLTEVLLLVFAKITGEQQLQTIFTNWQTPLLLVGFALLVGLLSGIYPAFYLTSFRPAKIIKGGRNKQENGRVRSGLVVFQFVISIGLIISSMIVYQQLHFMQDKDKGLDQEGIIIIENMNELKDQAVTFRAEAERQSSILATSFARRVPAGSGIWMYTYKTPEMPESITIQTFPVDHDFLPTANMHLIDGRNFSKEMASDSAAVIINEAAAKQLGLGENPINAEINEGQRVVGVVSDFHFQSLREKIAPVVLTYAPTGSKLLIKTNSRQVSGVVAALEQNWRKFSPEEPMLYTFMDENFAKLATKESMLSQAITFFTLLAFIIATLGLFGLATFSTEQRTKEIGIRKVLGATVANIVSLLSKDFLKLVLVAFLIASGIAWFAMDRWLENFAYRVDINWWVFVLAGATAVGIALLTVGMQGVRAALANPVKALRSE